MRDRAKIGIALWLGSLSNWWRALLTKKGRWKEKWEWERCRSVSLNGDLEVLPGDKGNEHLQDKVGFPQDTDGSLVLSGRMIDTKIK